MSLWNRPMRLPQVEELPRNNMPILHWLIRESQPPKALPQPGFKKVKNVCDEFVSPCIYK